jgi:hypothetical protein
MEIYAAAAAACRPSANSSIIFLLNAGMSPGFRLETNPLSTTTSSPTQRAPALRMSTWIAGHDVIFLPRTRPALIGRTKATKCAGLLDLVAKFRSVAAISFRMRALIRHSRDLLFSRGHRIDSRIQSSCAVCALRDSHCKWRNLRSAPPGFHLYFSEG